MSTKSGTRVKKALQPTPISATIRLQFHQGFTFDDAIPLVGYFAEMGISHVYASPILTARKGSTHGYDIVDPTRISEELGGEAGLRRLVEGLRAAGMGLIADIVPNHMGVGGSENPWWQHVLEWGRASPYADWFDIDWSPKDSQLHGKLLAPFLGEPYGTVLDKGEIQLHFDADLGRLSAHYFSHQFPIAPADYATVLQQAGSSLLEPAIAQFAAIDYKQKFIRIKPGVENARQSLLAISRNAAGKQAIDAALQFYNTASANSTPALHALLERQHYRLTWWRNAADEINWRRFFEVSELAGVRVELDKVFEATHAVIFDLYAQGLIDGLRLDHIDGLAHPGEYCQKLRRHLERLLPKRPVHLRYRPYIIAEKILAKHEMLRADWALDGTTGYEFMDQVSAVLHDPRGAEPLGALWKAITGDAYEFPRHVESARRQLLSENLVGEFDATAAALHNIARANPQTRDYSLAAIKRVLREILVHFPVYRSYVDQHGISTVDRTIFDNTAANTRRTLSSIDSALVDIVFSWLSAELLIDSADHPVDARLRDLSQRAITRFQQLTPPLSAKSVEDTAFYRYGRLLSRNEVGSDPGNFCLSVEDFHRACTERLQHYPHTLLATATHDHKRGEDIRARIAVLSQSSCWTATVAAWITTNARFHIDLPAEEIGGAVYNAPKPWHELMLYQMIAGAWPYDLAIDDKEGLFAFATRLDEWQLKAIREAKRVSNWVQANEPYEKACHDFLFNILSADNNAIFLQSVYAFIQKISAAGAVNSLAQTLLRLTTPGIPDLYQGTELWDFSLVDPDNRRPVDYAIRQQLLRQDWTLDERLVAWKNGAIKQHIICSSLQFRQQSPALFASGAYIPLQVTGARAAHILAFMRRFNDDAAIIVVPRLCLSLLATEDSLSLALDQWEGTMIQLPESINTDIENVLSGQSCHVYSGQIHITKILTSLPLALLRLKLPVS